MSVVKKLSDAQWSKTLQAWHLPDTKEYPTQFNIAPEVKLHSETLACIEKFAQWLHSKRYSPNTIKTYTDAIGVFLQLFSKKDLSKIENNDIIIFNNEYILIKISTAICGVLDPIENKLSASYQNQMVNAVKLFFQTIQNRQIDIDNVHRPRKEKKLPNMLSKEEVKVILETHRNIKY